MFSADAEDNSRSNELKFQKCTLQLNIMRNLLLGGTVASGCTYVREGLSLTTEFQVEAGQPSVRNILALDFSC